MKDLSVRIGNLNFHYKMWGRASKDVIVCLHGTSGNAGQWWALAERFKKSYRVFALDQRGHGASDKPKTGYAVEDYEADLHAFCSRLELTNYILIGNSLGSRVSFYHAARHPDQVKAMVLIDLSFAMPEAEQQQSIQGHLTRPRRFANEAEALAFSKARPERFRWSEEEHVRGVKGDFFVTPDGGLELKYGLDAAVQTLQRARADLMGYASLVQCPVLLMKGSESKILSLEVAQGVADAMPNCRLAVVPEAGHTITRDNPQLFLKLAGDFLEEVS